jgi:outer membrane protein, multidrug efflux system
LIKNHIAKYVLPLTLLYEFDFWGKWRNQYKAAVMRTQAEMEAYQTALLLLTTDLANIYFQLRIQDAHIKLLKEILETRNIAFRIQQSRYDVQLINHLDVSFYQTDYSTIEAEYFDALKVRVLFENQLALLLGISASEFTFDSLPLKAKPPQLPATLPAAVLLRRPDLAEQERRMAAIHAQINAAYASFLPAVDLVASFTFLSNNFVKTVANTWAIGSNLTEILFDAGGRLANVKLFIAQFNEACALYRQIALTAFQEVEDSLSSILWIENEMGAIENAIDAMDIAYQISLDRYRFGLSSYLDVANNGRTALDQQQLYLQLLSQLYLHTLHLIKAIGGGW